MKTNKIFRWLYGLFMLMPLIAIGVTCAYVTFNKNAYQSYSDNDLIQENVTQQSDFTLNDRYYFTSYNNNVTTTESNIGSYNQRIYFDEVEVIANSTNINYSLAASIGFYKQSGNTNIGFVVYDAQNNTLGTSSTTNAATISFRYLSNGLNDYFLTLGLFYKVEQTNYLDNAFYYAVDQFNESGFNKVNFVSFFDMFYNNENIWTTFANTYFNYVLFVSLAFFVPRVLFWFINLGVAYADGFIERSQRW